MSVRGGLTTALLLLGGGLMGFLKGSGVASSVISSMGVTMVLYPVPAALLCWLKVCVDSWEDPGVFPCCL